MQKKITLSGGFHNSAPINIAVALNTYNRLKSGEVSLTDYHVLTGTQIAKLKHHFCGVRGCKCGSYARATIDFNERGGASC